MVLLIAGCAGTVRAPDSQEPAATSGDKNFELDRFRWQGDMGGRECVIAANEWGDLRVRTTHRGEMAISAVIQKIGVTEDEFEILVEPAAECMEVRVATKTPEPGGRVDLTLLVPPGLRLEGRTRDGLTEIKYDGDVAARTRGGQIIIASLRTASASSISGDIIARLDGSAWGSPLEFESERGDIIVSLPDDANAELHARTTGAIDSEFPGRTTASAYAGTSLDETLGHGGPNIEITSDSGNVRIVARPK
ncbi:hypothetical protein BH24PSE2_BH24PSE2_04090 [soil metagenome]